MEKSKIKVLDLETTGLGRDGNPSKIVEMAIVDFSSGKEKKTHKVFRPDISESRKKDFRDFFLVEGKAIAKIEDGAASVHGITNEDVADKEPFSSVADKVGQYLSDGYILTMNGIRFDIPIIIRELRDCGVGINIKPIDVLVLHRYFNPDAHPKTIEDLVKIYDVANYHYDNMAMGVWNAITYKFGLTSYDAATMSLGSRNIDAACLSLHYACDGNRLEDLYSKYVGGTFEAHQAYDDCIATHKVYNAMKEKYGFTDEQAFGISIPTDGEQLSHVCNHVMLQGDDNVPVLAFGKYKGVPLEDFLQDPSTEGMVDWITNKDFNPYFVSYLLQNHVSKRNK